MLPLYSLNTQTKEEQEYEYLIVANDEAEKSEERLLTSSGITLEEQTAIAKYTFDQKIKLGEEKEYKIISHNNTENNSINIQVSADVALDESCNKNPIIKLKPKLETGEQEVKVVITNSETQDYSSATLEVKEPEIIVQPNPKYKKEIKMLLGENSDFKVVSLNNSESNLESFTAMAVNSPVQDQRTTFDINFKTENGEFEIMVVSYNESESDSETTTYSSNFQLEPIIVLQKYVNSFSINEAAEYVLMIKAVNDGNNDQSEETILIETTENYIKETYTPKVSYEDIEAGSNKTLEYKIISFNDTEENFEMLEVTTGFALDHIEPISNLTLNSIGKNIFVSFDTDFNSEFYEVEYRTGEDPFVMYDSGPNNNYELSLELSTEYDIRVRGGNENRYGEYSNVVTIATEDPLETVTGVSLSCLDKDITLNFERPQGVNGYKIFRSSDALIYLEIGETLFDTYVDENLDYGKTYSYKIKTTAPGEISEFSEVFNINTDDILLPPILSNYFVDYNKIELELEEIPNADKYKVFLNNIEVKESSEKLISIQDLKIDEAYSLQLVSLNDFQTSEKSVDYFFNTEESLENITVTSQSEFNNNLFFEFDFPLGINKVEVYKSEDNITFEKVEELIDQNRYEEFINEKNKIVYFKFKTVQGFKISSFSEVLILTTEQEIFPPENITTSSNSNRVSISWDFDASIQSYNIYRGLNEQNITLVGNTEQNSYIDENLEADTEYFYKVSSVFNSNSSPLSDLMIERTKQEELVVKSGVLSYFKADNLTEDFMGNSSLNIENPKFVYKDSSYFLSINEETVAKTNDRQYQAEEFTLSFDIFIENFESMKLITGMIGGAGWIFESREEENTYAFTSNSNVFCELTLETNKKYNIKLTHSKEYGVKVFLNNKLKIETPLFFLLENSEFFIGHKELGASFSIKEIVFVGSSMIDEPIIATPKIKEIKAKSSSAEIIFEDVSEATHFEIYRSRTKNGEYELVETIERVEEVE